MKKLTQLLGAFMLLIAMPAHAAPVVGETAPDFMTTDIHGNAFKLSDHKGKIVVLEWTNHKCPFVIKHYRSGNMQATQKAAAAIDGVEWISIVSSAPGKQGNVDAKEAQKIVDDQGATITAKILDPSGAIGKLYAAKTTPHMFVIDTQGTLAYAGAIDDKSSPSPKTIKGAKNYVLAALDNLTTGQPVETPQTMPYGCAVKY